MIESVRVSGIILAGGRSTRFGRDKLAEPIGGASLLQHAVRGLAAVCDEILVVVAPTASDPVVESSARLRVVRDSVEGEGPLAGLLAGLGAADGPLAIVAAGDMPSLRAAVLTEMVRTASGGSSGAVALGEAGAFRPLPCVLHTQVALSKARPVFDAGSRSLHSVLEALDVRAVPEDVWTILDPERATLRDIDRPQDLGHR